MAKNAYMLQQHSKWPVLLKLHLNGSCEKYLNVLIPESRMTDQKPSCNRCRYAVFQDYGYSNYTIEGVEFNCAIQLHPDGSFDRWYGVDTRLDYGSECSGYASGEPAHTDVEGDAILHMSDQQRQSLNLLGLWKL